MKVDIERLMESKSIIQALANGINPLNAEPISKESFFHDPQIIRPLFHITEYIDMEISSKSLTSKKPKYFIITPEQKGNVKLSEGTIGITDFAKAVNRVIDPNISKKLNGAMINRQLKLMGILSEQQDKEGKTRTILNKNSEGYGIISETRTFNGQEYEQVLFNETGKEFLLNNIENIMEFESIS